MDKKESILIIEDEKDIADLMKDYLEGHKFQVLTAASRNEAFFKINNQKFDCIVSDINLANNDVTPVLKELRSNQKGTNFGVPVIIHSAHVTGPIIRENKSLIKGVIVKPSPTDELLGKIKDCILKEKQREKAERMAKRQSLNE